MKRFMKWLAAYRAAQRFRASGLLDREQQKMVCWFLANT